MNLNQPLSPKRLFQVFAFIPLHLLSLQFLEGLTSSIEFFLESQLKDQPIWAGLIYFPVFCIASSIGNGLTFVSVRQIAQGKRPTFASSWKEVAAVLKPLIISSIVLGFIFVLGVMVFVLPAFYFMTLYLFVPQLILSEKNLSLSTYLYRSTRITKSAFWQCFFTVAGCLVIGVVSFLLAQTLGPWLGGLSQNALIRNILSLFVTVSFSVLSAAVVDLWIALLYLKLEPKNG